MFSQGETHCKDLQSFWILSGRLGKIKRPDGSAGAAKGDRGKDAAS
jgi:hypothetical protein